MLKKIPLAIIFAVALVFGTGGTAGAAEMQTIQAVPQKPAAPNFTLKDLNDKTHSLSDFRGKVVAVNFWATWCPPCRKELPSMQRAYKDYHKKGFVILGVNEGEDWDTIAPFLENFSLTYPILLDKESTVIGKWKVLGLPTTFIVDRKGRITHRINGGRNWDDPAFRKALEAAIDGD